jgi:hypothetical protein
MKKNYLNSFRVAFFLFLISLLVSCGTSTNSRYSKTDEQKKKENTSTEDKIANTSTLKEDFDITPYKTEIVIPEKKTYSRKNEKNIWFDYGTQQTETKPKSLVGTEQGYRVLVLTTDNFEEADQIKADIYFSKIADEVYVDFEPPFYKVKVGDFESQKSADDLKFKLSQLGYKEAKVIKDKINIFK